MAPGNRLGSDVFGTELLKGSEEAWEPVQGEAGSVTSCFEGSAQETSGQGRVHTNVIAVMVNMVTGESFFPAFIRVCPLNRIRNPAEGLGTHCHKQSSGPANAGRRLPLPFQT